MNWTQPSLPRLRLEWGVSELGKRSDQLEGLLKRSWHPRTSRPPDAQFTLLLFLLAYLFILNCLIFRMQLTYDIVLVSSVQCSD